MFSFNPNNMFGIIESIKCFHLLKTFILHISRDDYRYEIIWDDKQLYLVEGAES